MRARAARSGAWAASGAASSSGRKGTWLNDMLLEEEDGQESMSSGHKFQVDKSFSTPLLPFVTSLSSSGRAELTQRGTPRCCLPIRTDRI